MEWFSTSSSLRSESARWNIFFQEKKGTTGEKEAQLEFFFLKPVRVFFFPKGELILGHEAGFTGRLVFPAAAAG